MLHHPTLRPHFIFLARKKKFHPEKATIPSPSITHPILKGPLGEVLTC